MIVQLSPPRTGSTVIWQMLRDLCVKVEKDHQWDPRFDGAKIIATMRDPRDMCASMWRVENNLSADEVGTGRKMNRSEMADSIQYARAVSVEFHDLWTRPDVLWLRYERFWDDLGYALDQIAAYLEREVSQEERETILGRWCLEANRARAAQFDKYTEFDASSHIHGHHIGRAAPGYWMECVQPLHHEWFSRAIMREFEGWGL